MHYAVYRCRLVAPFGEPPASIFRVEVHFEKCSSSRSVTKASYSSCQCVKKNNRQTTLTEEYLMGVSLFDRGLVALCVLIVSG